MKKVIFLILVVVIVSLLFYFFPTKKSDAVRIGIVVPVQNIALDDIVLGFQEELRASVPDKEIDFIVQNASGDINLQKSITNKFINDKVDLLVPIGKAATLMALSLAPDEQTILFLAALIPPDSEIAKRKPSLLGLIDEIPVEKQISFMHEVTPELTKVAVIFASSDKVFDDVKDFEENAHKFGITTQKLMVQNLAEIYTVSSRIENNNQAIFILKDILVTSGINALVQQANNLKIPLITSDEGTIKSGGAYAVGVVEKDIGRQGAKIAADFIHKKTFERIQYLNKISVFMNTQACKAQGVDVEAVKNAAKKQKLDLIEG